MQDNLCNANNIMLSIRPIYKNENNSMHLLGYISAKCNYIRYDEKNIHHHEVFFDFDNQGNPVTPIFDEFGYIRNAINVDYVFAQKDEELSNIIANYFNKILLSNRLINVSKDEWDNVTQQYYTDMKYLSGLKNKISSNKQDYIIDFESMLY